MFSKIITIRRAAILMMSAKLTTLRLPKIKTFSNKDYNVIIYAHGIIIISSNEPNYVLGSVMSPETLSFVRRKLLKPQF